jgi:hypothetical protein
VRDQSFEYDKYRQVFTIGSFGKKSELNTVTGKISVSIGGKSFEYPYSVHLSNDDGKILTGSAKNGENIRKAVHFVNSMHQVLSQVIENKNYPVRD